MENKQIFPWKPSRKAQWYHTGFIFSWTIYELDQK